MPGFELSHSQLQGCLWLKQKWTRSILVDLYNVHTRCKICFTGRIYSYQNGNCPSSTHSLLQTSLKSELHDGFSLITSFVQSLPSLWLLSVTNTKRGEPKLLLNLLNSRAKAIPTLCYRLLLSVIQMTMTALPPSPHPKPTQNPCSVCTPAYIPSMHDMCDCLGISNLTVSTCTKTLQFNMKCV